MTMLLAKEKKYQKQSLRPYQAEAVIEIVKAWNEKHAPLAALATGAGKTTIIAQVLVEQAHPVQKRALVIAHTKEIVEQLYERIANQFEGRLNGDHLYGPYMSNGLGMVMGEHDDPDARIVVASRQSLHEKRLPSLFRTGPFDVIIVDEAHHALNDNTYGTIIKAAQERNPNVRLLGVTATPKRTDKEALGSLFDTICYEWLIPQGIAQGYLVPVQRQKVKTAVDVSKIKNVGGDYNEKKLISALDAANWLSLCVEAFNQNIAKGGRQTLAFMPSVEMSKDFARALSAAGIAAAHIDGTTPKEERKDILTAYQSGRLQVVSNMAVLTEGFDAPATSAIFLGRPTRSSTLFTQIVGRGLRPAYGKNDCLLIDMTVVDTKALEIGTLLGKMRVCEVCGTDYYSALTHCPKCKTARPAKKLGEVLEEKILGGFVPEGMKRDVGGELVSEYTPLFEKAFAAWFHGTDGFLSCILSFEDGVYIIVPPLEDEYYRLTLVPKGYKEPVQVLQRHEDLAALLIDADALIRAKNSTGADKDAPWRSQVASPAQIDLLRKEGVTVPNNMTRGAASQLISHTFAVKRLLEFS